MYKQHTKSTFTALAIPTFAIFLSGCGGGSETLSGSINQGGSGTVSQYDYSQGSPSTEANANAALSRLNGTNNGNDFVATTDTNARTAWRAGWTGKDVKVGIVDEFNANNVRDTHGDNVAFVIQSIAPEATFKRFDFFSSDFDNSIEDPFKYLEADGYHIINASFGISRVFEGDEDFDERIVIRVAGFDQEA